MTMLAQPIIQKSFVVTVWQQPKDGIAMGEQWRFCLEDPQTQQRRVFVNPQALIVALKEGTLDDETVSSRQ